MEIFIFIFKYIPILSALRLFSMLIMASDSPLGIVFSPKKYLSLHAVQCSAASSLSLSFCINVCGVLQAWPGQSVVIRRRGAANDRQATKVPRLETTPVLAQPGPAYQ